MITKNKLDEKRKIAPITIGESDLRCYPLGIGTMSWSNSRMWGYGSKLGLDAAREAFAASLDAGVNLFDTAEIYGNGRSERVVGELLRGTSAPVITATKFAPMPWRFTAGSFWRALDGSLKRLGLEKVDLYQVHFPLEIIKIEKLMNILADAVDEGKVRYIGVSNYSAEQMLRAYKTLAARGIPLVSNQVEYSLIQRSPEVNGVLKTCRELNITLIAYSPIGRGVLNGSYRSGASAKDARRIYRQFKDDQLKQLKPLLDAMQVIGSNYGKSLAQVALNWLARQPGVLPIPGAKHAEHARSSAEALGWEMPEQDALLLDELSSGYKRA